MSRRRGFGQHYATDEEVRALGWEPGRDGWTPIEAANSVGATPQPETVPAQSRVRNEGGALAAGAVSEPSQPAPMPAPGDDMQRGLTFGGEMFCPSCGSQMHQQQRWRKKDAEYRRDCHDCQWTSGWLPFTRGYSLVGSPDFSQPAQEPAQQPAPAAERAQEPRKRAPRPARPARAPRGS